MTLQHDRLLSFYVGSFVWIFEADYSSQMNMNLGKVLANDIIDDKRILRVVELSMKKDYDGNKVTIKERQISGDESKVKLGFCASLEAVAYLQEFNPMITLEKGIQQALETLNNKRSDKNLFENVFGKDFRAANISFDDSDAVKPDYQPGDIIGKTIDTDLDEILF